MNTSRDRHHAHLGEFVFTGQALLRPNRAQNLTILSLATAEKFKGVQNSKMDHVTLVTSLSGTVGRPKAND